MPIPFRVGFAVAAVSAAFFGLQILMYVLIGCLWEALTSFAYMLVAMAVCYLVVNFSRLERRLKGLERAKMHKNA